MARTEGATVCEACGEKGHHYCKTDKTDALRDARWALRAAVNMIDRPLRPDNPIEKFIIDQNAKCDLVKL